MTSTCLFASKLKVGAKLQSNTLLFEVIFPIVRPLLRIVLSTMAIDDLQSHYISRECVHSVEAFF